MIYTKSEAAARLNIHPKTLEKWIGRGDFAERSGFSRDRSGRVVFKAEIFDTLSELSQDSAPVPATNRSQPRPAPIGRRFLSIREAAAICGLPRTVVRRAFAVKLGGRLFVDRYELDNRSLKWIVESDRTGTYRS